MADPIVVKVGQEAERLTEHIRRVGELTWDSFIIVWWRAVRRGILGDAARDDHALTDLLTRLRRDANWSYFTPTRRRLRERFDARLRAHRPCRSR
ncbi:MAG TPA: hypothetical protein VK923_05845 [Euzebyales bacterium]|nr:hypothetical protein [Euzebyales bacterium]